ncbi:hypothetical protein pdam_00010124 [Pocillopora damicornis]|uniref:Uncharacterized protein n=1 Tax=Pocillopora damicornis TaxID=46731 RepID=A0A3M6V2Q5_POCDA|nr:hypothetical protein pdam_00010124 [Pocillopora damicornis]
MATNIHSYLAPLDKTPVLLFTQYCNTGEYISKSASAEGAENVDGLDDEKKNKRAIDKTTLKLDWILGDDPSQVVIPGSPTLRVDTPASAVPPDSIEVPLMALETIAEQDETIPRRAARKGTSVNTWPRMRQTPNDRRVPENLAASKDSVFSGSSLNGVDIGVHQSGFETGLSTETVDNIMPKISKHTVKNVEIGTQTEFSRVDVHETVKEEINLASKKTNFGDIQQAAKRQRNYPQQLTIECEKLSSLESRRKNNGEIKGDVKVTNGNTSDGSRPDSPLSDENDDDLQAKEN